MTGSIPLSIGNLTQLQEIKLNVNYFGCYKIDEITGVCKEYCDEENGCSAEVPESLTKLSKLEEFIIKDNYFIKLPNDMENLIRLKKISTSNKKNRYH